MTPTDLSLLLAYIEAAAEARMTRHSCGPRVAEARRARDDAFAALMAHVKDATR